LKKAEQFEACFGIELGRRQRDICGFNLPVATVDGTGLAGVGRGFTGRVDGNRLWRSDRCESASGESASEESTQKFAE
jgi:hypothetical protein